jgi:hypothetical protein
MDIITEAIEAALIKSPTNKREETEKGLFNKLKLQFAIGW